MFVKHPSHTAAELSLDEIASVVDDLLEAHHEHRAAT
jgi:hypothetical protein